VFYPQLRTKPLSDLRDAVKQAQAKLKAEVNGPQNR
jgi:hypothetical protein